MSAPVEPPPAADNPLEPAEDERIDGDPDDEQGEHGGHESLDVGRLPGVLQPDPE